MLSEDEARSNADLAYRELRAQIEQQLKAADSIDTKTTALMTGGAAIIALVGGRIQVGSETPRIVAALILFTLALTFLFCALKAISSRDNFAYGAKPEELVQSLEQYPHVAVGLAVAGSLRDARNKNSNAINAKHAWYQRTVGLTFGLAASIAILFAVGAIR